MDTDFFTYFETFAQISKSIHSGTDTGDILECIVSNITKITEAKGSILWIINTKEKKIETKISQGFPYRSLSLVTYDTLTQIFDIVGKEKVHIEDARYDDRIPDLERLGKKQVRSVTGLFFKIDPSYTGILAVYFAQSRKLTDNELKLVTALGEQGAISLYKALYLNDKLLQAVRQVIEGFVLTLEAKDTNTHGHSLRVADFARMTATAMSLTTQEIETIYHGALLHDIGKIGIEDYLLEKLGILNSKEMDIVKKHPLIGSKIVKPLNFFKEIEPLILHHHEKYDGSGYPSKLRKEEIPLGARIISVCDAFETMISGRTHCGKKTINEAVCALQGGVGLKFDPKVVKAFFAMLQDHPEMIDEQGAVERCKAQLCLDIDAISLDNILRRELDAHSMGCF